MVFNAQTRRAIKVFTAFATVGVGIQAVLFADYNYEGFEGQDHIFTQLQKDFRTWVDKSIYGIDVTATGSRNKSLPSSSSSSNSMDRK